jgi:hypothetical protein
MRSKVRVQLNQIIVFFGRATAQAFEVAFCDCLNRLLDLFVWQAIVV